VKKTNFEDLLREHDLLNSNYKEEKTFINNELSSVKEKSKLGDLLISIGITQKPMKVDELLQEAGITVNKPKEILQSDYEESKALLDDYEESEALLDDNKESSDSIEDVIELDNKITTFEPTQQKEEEEEEEDSEKELIKKFDSIIKGENKEFDSSWIERSEFTSVTMGSDLHPNINSDVVHKLNTPYHDLDIKILIKLKNLNSKKEYQCELQKYISPDGKYGVYITPISNNIVRINTGSEGIIIYIAKQNGEIEKKLLSNVNIYTTYYRIIVRKAFSVDASTLLRRGGGFTSSIPVGIPGPTGPAGPVGVTDVRNYIITDSGGLIFTDDGGLVLWSGS